MEDQSAGQGCLLGAYVLDICLGLRVLLPPPLESRSPLGVSQGRVVVGKNRLSRLVIQQRYFFFLVFSVTLRK